MKEKNVKNTSEKTASTAYSAGKIEYTHVNIWSFIPLFHYI